MTLHRDTRQIAQFRIFENISAPELDLILQFGSEDFYKPEEIILKEDREVHGSDLFLVLSGMVKIQIEATNIQPGLMNQKRLAVLKCGDVFGEIGFLGSRRRSANVYAYSDVRVVRFDRQQLFEFFGQQPELGLRFLHNLATILADRLVDMNFMWRDAI